MIATPTISSRAALSALSPGLTPRALSFYWALMVALAGCGGGGGEQDAALPHQTAVLLDRTVTVSASSPEFQAAWSAEVSSPRFTPDGKAGTVEVCASGTWVQQMAAAGPLSMSTTLAGDGQEATVAGVAGANMLAFQRCTSLDVAAGDTASRTARMRFDVRSPSGLGSYVVTVRWVVTEAQR